MNNLTLGLKSDPATFGGMPKGIKEILLNRCSLKHIVKGDTFWVMNKDTNKLVEGFVIGVDKALNYITVRVA